jgi:cytochrome c oxidase subunit I
MKKNITFLFALAVLANVFVLVFAWAHHLFVVGWNPFLELIVFLLTLAVIVPFAMFAVRRLARDFGAERWTEPAAAFILGAFIFLFWHLVNGPAYWWTTLDIQVHDTLFVLAHTQVTIVFIAVMLFFAGVYTGYPRATGRVMNAPMGYLHFAMTFVVLLAISEPLHYIGLTDMPRRYLDYRAWVSFDQFGGGENLWRWLAILLVCGQLLFVVNLVYSAVRGKVADGVFKNGGHKS